MLNCRLLDDCTKVVVLNLTKTNSGQLVRDGVELRDIYKASERCRRRSFTVLRVLDQAEQGIHEVGKDIIMCRYCGDEHVEIQ